MKETILDAAERRARRGGYNGFSFRDLANDVGIKSASIHYHFPTKENLAEALAERYVGRMEKALGDPAQLTPLQAVERLAGIFLSANETDDQMCLCGIFAAESGGLPAPVVPRVAAFFDLIVGWLDVALAPLAGKVYPSEIIATLEGGILMARVKRDPAILRNVAAALKVRIQEASASRQL